MKMTGDIPKISPEAAVATRTRTLRLWEQIIDDVMAKWEQVPSKAKYLLARESIKNGLSGIYDEATPPWERGKAFIDFAVSECLRIAE